MSDNESERGIRMADSSHDVPISDFIANREAIADGPRKCGRKPSPEKRIRILEAAVRLFTTKDYHEVLMDEVAEQAGVGKGTVYRYFPTKESLFLELVHLAVDRASEVIRAGISNPEPAIKRLRKAVAMTLEYFRLNEPFLAILYHDKVFRCCKERRDIENKRAELRGFFARLLAEGIAEGSVRADIEPALCSVVLMGSIRGLLRNFGSTRTSDQLAEQLLSIFIDGAAARPSSGERPAMRPTSQISALDAATLARLDPLASLNELSLGMNLYEDPSMATESNDTQGEPGTNRPAGVEGLPGVQST
ncbi:MAG: TetR/AcrR family transcriptional regulator [Planctomycetota bacterium]|nr:TetR/AcrR family transcriptional regulator [Planctomycetota bacterium]